jgi:tRNA uridine 5-carbamoylmethylation protein Kti12
MELIMLAGIPTSGKSSYTKTLLSQPYWENAVVLSTDDYIQRVAEKRGKTYDEVFKATIGEATDFMWEQLKFAIHEGRDIIVDRTNLTKKTRKQFLSKVPNHCKKSAVYFEISLKEALERNKHREGKMIPEKVLKSMYHSFEIPNNTENFDAIERGN